MNSKNRIFEKAERIMGREVYEIDEERIRKIKQEQKEIERDNKIRAKIAKRREKLKKMEEKKKNKNGKKGLLIATVILSSIAVTLATALMIVLIMPNASDNSLESIYKKSFYDTVEQVNNIDVNLSKALVTKDSIKLTEYLTDTAINSSLAESDLSTLPLEDDSKFYTIKLINQIGDFCKYLNKKINNNENVTEEDLQILTELYKGNIELRETLNRIIDNINFSNSFISVTINEDIVGNLSKLQNLSVNYPKLIYDGPFSDGQINRVIRGLEGEEISEEKAREKFIQTFSGYNITKTVSQGLTTGDIPCYNFSALVKGETLYGEIAKYGGDLILFAYSGSCQEEKITQDESVEKANEFLVKQGYIDMKAVWINLANNVYTINFAYTKNNTIVYSDLIKVRVCAETGMVIGLEGSSYYINHRDREIGSPILSRSYCQEKVSDNILIQTCRLCIVPYGNESEKLCYEFCGTFDSETYYVFIDATNGKQIEMFKVIESTEGTLLM